MKIRWGIFGAGKISNDFTTAVNSQLKENHTILAVASRDLGRGQQFADKHNIPRVYGAYVDLTEDPDIDVVYVGTHIENHYKHCLQLLGAGKHVLCEKPLTMSEEETKTLIKEAQNHNVFFMEALWSRFFPVYMKIKESLASGVIGEVLSARACFCKHVEGRVTGIGEIGIYVLQFLLMAFGDETPDVFHAAGVRSAETEVDEAGNITMIYGDKMATAQYSKQFTLNNDAFIAGTKGYIKIPEYFWCPTRVEINGETHEFPLPETEKDFNYTNSMGLHYEAEHVRQCLLTGRISSDVVPWSLSLILTQFECKVRSQINARYE